MKKINKFILAFSLVFSILSFLMINISFVDSNQVYAEEPSIVEVTKQENITNTNTTYVLKNDLLLEYTDAQNSFCWYDFEFQGTLNGNGYSIIINPYKNQNQIYSIFKSIKNSNIFNLNIKILFNPDTLDNGVFVYSDLANSQGLLAQTINNSTITGVNISFVPLDVPAANPETAPTKYVFKIEDSTATGLPTVNIGLLAGEVYSSDINQIKIQNCSLESYSTTTQNVDPDADPIITYSPIKSSSNIGLLIGNCESSSIKNCQITNSVIDLNVKNDACASHNISSFVGVANYTNFINNILSIQTQSLNRTLKVNKEGESVVVSAGNLIGKSKYNITIYDNILNLSNNPQVNLGYCGQLIGHMEQPIPAENIASNIFTSSDLLIGYKVNVSIDNSSFVETYKNIEIDIDESILINRMKDYTFWHNLDGWNFNTIWKPITSGLPSLQYFEKFDLVLNKEDSLGTLSNIGDLSTKFDEIIKFESDDLTPDNTILTKGYNSFTSFTAKISDYSETINKETKTIQSTKYFEIAGLAFNGKQVVKIEKNLNYDASATEPEDKYNIDCLQGFSCDMPENLTSVTFKVDNINATKSGNYTIILKKIQYKYCINVNPTEEGLIPGKIRMSNALNYQTQQIGYMEYGSTYKFITGEVNSDYSTASIWSLINPNDKDNNNLSKDADLYEYTYFKDNLTSTFEWTFDEKLLSDIKNKLSINTFIENSDFNIEEDYALEIFVDFPKNVREVNIVFKLTNDQIINEEIAQLKINYDVIEPEIVDDKLVYKVKLPYGSSNVKITITSLSSKYTFESWMLGSSKIYNLETDDPYDATFDVVKDASQSDKPLEIKCVLKLNETYKNGSLLWLWILLGVLGGGGLIALVVVLIVIKKRKGSSSYKKYMY